MTYFQLFHTFLLCTVQTKSLDTPSHSKSFLYFHDYENCRFTLKASKLWINTCGIIYGIIYITKKCETTENMSYCRFFKVATFCFDYCFAHSWHSLDELQEVVTWNGLPTVLKEFPERCLALVGPFAFCLRSSSPLNHLDWVQVWWLWRPGHLAQHPITLLLAQIALDAFSVTLQFS